MHDVALPLARVIVLSVLTTIIPYHFISNKILNFLVVIAVSTSAIMTYSYYLCFDQTEKMLINQFVNRIIRKFK